MHTILKGITAVLGSSSSSSQDANYAAVIKTSAFLPAFNTSVIDASPNMTTAPVASPILLGHPMNGTTAPVVAPIKGMATPVEVFDSLLFDNFTDINTTEAPVAAVTFVNLSSPPMNATAAPISSLGIDTNQTTAPIAASPTMRRLNIPNITITTAPVSSPQYHPAADGNFTNAPVVVVRTFEGEPVVKSMRKTLAPVVIQDMNETVAPVTAPSMGSFSMNITEAPVLSPRSFSASDGNFTNAPVVVVRTFEGEPVVKSVRKTLAPVVIQDMNETPVAVVRTFEGEPVVKSVRKTLAPVLLQDATEAPAPVAASTTMNITEAPVSSPQSFSASDGNFTNAPVAIVQTSDEGADEQMVRKVLSVVLVHDMNGTYAPATAPSMMMNNITNAPVLSPRSFSASDGNFTNAPVAVVRTFE
eukprot:CAMPEP_0202474270 /NCGR_PEP_ID=MMETSP1360-20130828/92290_1 /ASSEMBLY_ACC=CAM_ASM_000848 /TAXON_ID=515479 /ORGANISM="Licmophora paradoxa, Strain CCMP2313" /LENGTH=415 /DNA_ID=CAMNT_0049101379 /DNA_START=105 /DNA_END=1349 /DNA_ORIENTATION=-